MGLQTRITDRASLDKAGSNIAGSAYCNYAMSITASPANVNALDDELEADERTALRTGRRERFGHGNGHARGGHGSRSGSHTPRDSQVDFARGAR